MLRIQNYNSLRVELDDQYGDTSQFVNSGLSYICTARGNTIQGYVLVKATTASDSLFEISHLFVMPRYRNKGYAKRLIEMVQEKCCTGQLCVDCPHIYQRLFTDSGFVASAVDDDGFVRLTWDMKHRCYHCKLGIKPGELIQEVIPTGLALGDYGFERIETLQNVCWRCRTRVES
jgi:GNAT superfamily N-acetyltransferase